jgi:hypothetical protein
VTVTIWPSVSTVTVSPSPTLRPQPQDAHRMGRERRSQRRLRAARLRRMEKAKTFGVYFIFKSMEQGRTFRISDQINVQVLVPISF